MTERGKGKKCLDCANWKVKDSPCTYYDEIVKGLILKTDPACTDFFPKGKEKNKIHKTSGLSDQGYYEAIYHNGKPAFLTLRQETFSVINEVTAEADSFLPKEFPSEFPYEPYGFYEGSVPSREDLFWIVRDEFNLFLDLESIWKDYLAACVLLSYQQEKLRTVPYPYFVGDNESGKSVALSLLNWLCYRPMMGVTIPSADIYGYLDDSDAPGTILEEEAQGMQKDMDKSKIYKAGYKKGAVVPRTVMMQNKRFIKYFRVFCFKACAAEEMPRVKGLMERFIFIPMTEGYPTKDWADFGSADEKRLRELRSMLLKWRLLTMEWQIPEVELPVKGRLKELWKPVIQVVSGLTVEKDLRAHLELLQKERLSERINTLEGHIVKVVCDLFVFGELLSFSAVWDALVVDLGGKLDDKKPNKMDTAEFTEVSKQNVGYRLREVLGGKKAKVVGHENDRVYVFDAQKLKRIAKKYGCDLKNKLLEANGSEGEVSNQRADKWTTKASSAGITEEIEQNHVVEEGLFSEKEPKMEVEKDEKQTKTSLEVAQVVRLSAISSLEELTLSAKSIYRLTTDCYGTETCVVCGVKGRPDWQVTQFDDSWGFLCGKCGLKLSEKLSNHN
jgi:hypothetical protein